MEDEEYVCRYLGFHTADAEDVEFSFSFSQSSARLSFKDWKENEIKIVFDEVLAISWQEAELHPDRTRDDETYEVLNSKWKKAHLQHALNPSELDYHHYKLGFNACDGFLEVLCQTIRLVD